MKMYFKVYMDKNNIDTYYVDTKRGIEDSLTAWKEEYNEGGIELFPIIEPILMTEKEFNNLPEFGGF